MNFKIIGFTGSRAGMTEKQAGVVKRLLIIFGVKILHHGDCIGSDTRVHKISTKLGLDTHIHPPKNPTLRAFNKGTKIFESREYLDRNKDIAQISEALIATPRSMTVQTGGTWYTIRYARLIGKRVYIITPEGDLQIMRKKEKNENRK